MTSPLDAALKARTGRPHRDVIKPPRLLNISPDQDERTVRGSFIEKHSILGTARGPLAASREFRARYNDVLKVTRDIGAFAKHAGEAAEAITRKYDNVIPALRKQLEQTNREIAKVLNPPAKDETAVEIRQHFKGSKSPFEEASKLIEQGDLQSVRAIINVPPYLAGLTAQQQATLTLQARSKWCGDLNGLATDLEKAITRVEAEGAGFATEVNEALRELKSGGVDASAFATES